MDDSDIVLEMEPQEKLTSSLEKLLSLSITESLHHNGNNSKFNGKNVFSNIH